MERRIRRLGIFMVLCFLALFIQLNNIQVIKAHALATSPNNPAVISQNRDNPRGEILSSNGVVLAYSTLANGGPYKYQRNYNPITATLFSQIVGYDSINYGLTGIEAEYNDYLKSHTRPAKTLRDLLVNRTTTDNVYLTINTTLQAQVAAIVQGINTHGAPDDVAGAVVINVKTGAIEAMYGKPTFDPTPLVSTDIKAEKYAWYVLGASGPDSGQSPLVSRAYQYGYLPGSTFKVVTSAAVYDHDPALAKVNYPVTQCINVPERVDITGKPIPLCNYAGVGGSHESCGGMLTVTLPQSCDTAFAQMGEALGTNLAVEAASFGFNQQVPIDLPAAVSEFPSVQQLTNNPALAAVAAFGQGDNQQSVIATPLQMALVAAGIANQGVIMTPHVMEQIRDSQGNLVETYQPHPWLTATSPVTAAAVTSLMKGVVATGTAAGVFPASWNVAAKTGTAETGTGTAAGNNLTNDWMIAFAPANDPTVAVAVAVPNQPASATGAEISGPPTKAILGDALGLTP